MFENRKGNCHDRHNRNGMALEIKKSMIHILKLLCSISSLSVTIIKIVVLYIKNDMIQKLNFPCNLEIVFMLGIKHCHAIRKNSML